MRHPAAVVVMAAALLSAGCSAATESKPSPESTPSPESPGAHGGLADCLHANGVPESTGPAAVLGPPAGVEQSVWDAAMRACSTLAPGPSAP